MPRPAQLEEREAARLRHGLSKQEIHELWEMLDKAIPKSVVEGREEMVSAAINDAWRQYAAAVRKALDWEFNHPEAFIEGKPCISTIQAARVFGIGEFHMSNLREHGVVEPSYVRRRSFFMRKTLEHLIDKPMEGRERHNPLGAAFVRWVAMADAPYNARGLPVDVQASEAAS